VGGRAADEFTAACVVGAPQCPRPLSPAAPLPAHHPNPPKNKHETAPQEVWYQLGFEGFPASEAEWYPAARIKREHAHGADIIAAFEVRGREGLR
jgi:hypothetical protein